MVDRILIRMTSTRMIFRGYFLSRTTRRIALTAAFLACVASSFSSNPNRQVLIRDITSVEGVRDNMLVGYGLVVGLNRTGDSQQTYFTVQTLANAMQRMGVLIAPGTVEVKNVASVFVTASLPPFARPGAKLDVTVSSVGDAKSLVGGVLLMSALHGPDGQVYAEAQGPLVMGGYSAGNSSNGKEVNSTTVGIVPNGGIVERDTSVDLHSFKSVSLLLRNPDFTTAKEIADAVNQNFHKTVASALDSSRVDVNVADTGSLSVPDLISRVQNLSLEVHTPAKIVINERNGTIVLGGDVKLTPVSVIHGNLSIQVVTSYDVAAVPTGGNGGKDEKGRGRPDNRLQPVLVPETRVTANDAPAQTMRLDEGANVEELVNGLHAIGTSSRDVVAILQAIKAEGGLQAELEVQ
jgi:flagellar P-ring protein precursor FlgI